MTDGPAEWGILHLPSQGTEVAGGVSRLLQPQPWAAPAAPHQSHNLSLITFFMALKFPLQPYPTSQEFSPQVLCRFLPWAGHVLVQQNTEMNFAVSFWVTPFGLSPRPGCVLAPELLQDNLRRTLQTGDPTLHGNTASLHLCPSGSFKSCLQHGPTAWGVQN